MSLHKLYYAALDAVRAWRDKHAPGASVMVKLDTWEMAHTGAFETTLQLYVGGPDYTAARAALNEVGTVEEGLARLTEDFEARARIAAELAAQKGSVS